jgi:hypothetical protein
MTNDVLTAGRLNVLETCPRQSFWRHEIGLQKEVEDSPALAIGSAWARAMEVRWNGGNWEDALTAAIPEGIRMDLYTCAKIAAMVVAYYMHYGEAESEGKLLPEARLPKRKVDGFTIDGLRDAVGVLNDDREVLIESKTTRCRLDPDSDYWLRLSRNNQVLQYLAESRAEGRDISACYYDVTRKPSLKPGIEIVEKDEDGVPIVVDSDGKRVFKEVGKKGAKASVPKTTADKAKGQKVKSHAETPEEYRDRIYADILDRPEFYFCRKEIPVLDDQVEEFERKRKHQIALIKHYRSMEVIHECSNEACESNYTRDPEAWPAYVREQNCQHCSYKSFCLQGIKVDPNNPPKGFKVGPFNPELDAHDNTTEAADDE